ncbi:glutamate racemase [Buchnera aphidicola (Melanaphis sacchari)]|uniref:Glutamate racemase n=1 Tax=Buchnera aphidicola (Melanaphis sacchari) TaxID=2173854 RepID=A0A2U8DEJ1_9GAMM|nr:glutamate racemase [Buchnera aphidicola]AWH90268.1 glutamate racemase [Buchnera aphidicola (Melanaphis sacchari)]
MLIFDSGIGGLSILNIIKKEIPEINYIYVFDNEAFPYGKKKKQFLIKRSIKIIKKIKEKYPIKIVIIGCNTVSTTSLEILKNIFHIPIIGILPSLKHASNITKNKHIGLIATHATINSAYVKKIISKYSYLNNIKIIATNKLARISENKIRNLSISNTEIKNIFKPWSDCLTFPDTIILGCTHFSFIEKEIKKIFKKKSTILINPQDLIISKVKKKICRYLDNQNIKENIFLYSKNDKNIEQLLFLLKKYNFSKLKKISLY